MEPTKESFLELLGLLFEQSHHSIDDLLLEKLLNELERDQREKSRELLEDIDLSEIISALLKKNDVDQRIRSFGLQLIGLKVSTIPKLSNDDHQSLNKLLFQNIKVVQTQSCSAALKFSTLKMLRRLIEKDELKNLIAKSGVLTLATAFLLDNSMFVQQEAQLLLSDFLLKYLNSSDQIAVELLNHILETFDKRNKMYFIHSMMVLKRICKVAYHRKIETELLDLLWEEEEEFICQKVCEVLAVIHQISNNYSKIDDILRRLTSLNCLPISMSYCCDLFTKDLPSSLVSKLQSYLLVIMDSMKKIDKTSNDFRSSFSLLLKLNFLCLSEDFQNNYIQWFCNFLSQEQTELPKLILSVLNKLLIIYHYCNLDMQLLIKNTLIDIINLRMVADIVLLKALSVYGKLNKDLHSFSSIYQSISCLLYHPNWAVQDSVLELIGQVISDGNEESLNTISAKNLHLSVWEKLNMENSESFTRASALITLAEIARAQNLWENLIDAVDESKIINQIFIYVLTESEVIVRRAATKAITSIYLNNKSTSFKWKHQILSTMQIVISDSDWEVKHGALQFWKEIVKQVHHKHQYIKELDNLGFCYALISSIDDCDPTVRCEAACILSKIQEKLKPSELNLINVHGTVSNVKKHEEFLSTTANVICKPVDDNVMEAVLNICDGEVMNNKMNLDCEKNDSIQMESDRNIVLFGVEKFISILLSLDLEKIQKTANINADIYDDNLSLLIIDLIAMIKKNENSDVILDCY